MFTIWCGLWQSVQPSGQWRHVQLNSSPGSWWRVYEVLTNREGSPTPHVRGSVQIHTVGGRYWWTSRSFQLQILKVQCIVLILYGNYITIWRFQRMGKFVPINKYTLYYHPTYQNKLKLVRVYVWQLFHSVYLQLKNCIHKRMCIIFLHCLFSSRPFWYFISSVHFTVWKYKHFSKRNFCKTKAKKTNEISLDLKWIEFYWWFSWKFCFYSMKDWEWI